MLQKKLLPPLIVVAAATAFAASGCVASRRSDMPPELERSAQEDPPAPAEAAPKLPAAVQSVADWDSLPKDVREDIIEGDLHGYAALAVAPRRRLAELDSPEAKAFGEKMAAYMRAHGDMTVQDSTHARVGPAETWVQLVLLGGRTILGGEIRFEQKGCDMPDESVVTFKTEAEAVKAGCETKLGSWSAEGTFNHDGMPLAHGDYMEWNGK